MTLAPASWRAQQQNQRVHRVVVILQWQTRLRRTSWCFGPWACRHVARKPQWQHLQSWAARGACVECKVSPTGVAWRGVRRRVKEGRERTVRATHADTEGATARGTHRHRSRHATVRSAIWDGRGCDTTSSATWSANHAFVDGCACCHGHVRVCAHQQANMGGCQGVAVLVVAVGHDGTECVWIGLHGCLTHTTRGVYSKEQTLQGRHSATKAQRCHELLLRQLPVILELALDGLVALDERAFLRLVNRGAHHDLVVVRQEPVPQCPSMSGHSGWVVGRQAEKNVGRTQQHHSQPVPKVQTKPEDQDFGCGGPVSRCCSSCGPAAGCCGACNHRQPQRQRGTYNRHT